jgi:hypothetical protein
MIFLDIDQGSGLQLGLGGSASCSRAPPAVRFNTAALYQSEPEKVQP